MICDNKPTERHLSSRTVVQLGRSMAETSTKIALAAVDASISWTKGMHKIREQVLSMLRPQRLQEPPSACHTIAPPS